MIIKLHNPFTYARHTVVKEIQPLTVKEKVKSDRIVLIILFALTVLGAILFS